MNDFCSASAGLPGYSKLVARNSRRVAGHIPPVANPEGEAMLVREVPGSIPGKREFLGVSFWRSLAADSFVPVN